MRLPATATLEHAPALLEQLDAALAAAASGGRLVVDAAALQEFDTSAVALLLHGRRLASAQGVGFEVAAPPAKLRELARLYGVDELLAFV